LFANQNQAGAGAAGTEDRLRGVLVEGAAATFPGGIMEAFEVAPAREKCGR
jgi:hypothetical protein